jgi:hypothetical protein
MGWGMRKLAYEIRQRTEADYRLFRFETDGGVLDDLNHNLRIADGVLRFRIFRVDSNTPAIVPPPAMTTSGGTPARGGRRSTGSDRPDSASDGEEPGPGEAEADEASQEAAEPSSGPDDGEAPEEEQAGAPEDEQTGEPPDSGPRQGLDPQAEG